jgi:hypothetical protein
VGATGSGYWRSRDEHRLTRERVTSRVASTDQPGATSRA